MRLIDPTRPAAYAALVPGISKIAKEFGYCCAVHGSMATDLDIVLVPWVNEAKPADDVVEAIRLFVGGRKRKHDVLPQEKPHGRKAWSFYFCEDSSFSGVGGPWIDISVTPRSIGGEE